jgi:hypothetical protein
MDDLFDRDIGAICQKRGHGLMAGLEALWDSVFSAALTNDGRRSFSHYSLRLSSGTPKTVSIPLSPTHFNETVMKLRAWVHEDHSAIETIALHHAAWLVADPMHGTKRLLECAERALVVEDLACSW